MSFANALAGGIVGAVIAAICGAALSGAVVHYVPLPTLSDMERVSGAWSYAERTVMVGILGSALVGGLIGACGRIVDSVLVMVGAVLGLVGGLVTSWGNDVPPRPDVRDAVQIANRTNYGRRLLLVPIGVTLGCAASAGVILVMRNPRTGAKLAVAPHPLLDLHAFVTRFPRMLSAYSTPPNLLDLFKLEAAESTLAVPVSAGDEVHDAVRELLSYGGFNPSGRSKPASEYLLRAAGDGSLGSINLAVDICNIVSLHTGLPISLVDLDKAKPPFSVRIAPERTEYAFNASGETIDLEGLLCLYDAEGACGNAVSDAQRTKTDRESWWTLTLIWGTKQLPGYAAKVDGWYRKLLHEAGARTLPVIMVTDASSMTGGLAESSIDR